MEGSENRGEHNLKIVNATLQDIAEYQCQVGPAAGNRPIRSDAHLNVIGKSQFPLPFMGFSHSQS